MGKKGKEGKPKKKEGKHAPSSKKVYHYIFFNKRPFKKSAALTIETIAKDAPLVAAKYKVDDFSVWCTVADLEENLEKVWGTDDDHFQRWWADRLVMEYSYMVWNQVVDANLGEKRPENIGDRAQAEFEKKFF